MIIQPLWSSKFQIKSGTWVFVPTNEAVAFGRSLKELLEERWSAPRFYYHLRKGGHVAAIKTHLPNSYFVHLDIAKFFNHITRSRVTRWLKPYVGYREAREMACNSTVKIPDSNVYALPYGFVQSPILASLCLSKSKLGRLLAKMAKEKLISVSVYVDDIILSSNFLKDLESAVTELVDAASASSLAINEQKTEGPAVVVSSFNIEISNKSLCVTGERLELFKQALTRCKKRQEVRGILNYVGTINSAQKKALISFVPAKIGS